MEKEKQRAIRSQKEKRENRDRVEKARRGKERAREADEENWISNDLICILCPSYG